MHLIIIGAGVLGRSLASIASEAGDDVVLIEGAPYKAKKAAELPSIRVLEADVGLGVLEEAGLDSTDAIAATTESDATNLLAVTIGRQRERIDLMAVVNEAEHIPMFRRLGVLCLTEPEMRVGRNVHAWLRHPGLQQVSALPGGHGFSFELRVSDGAPIVGCTLAEAAQAGHLPDSVRIVSVERNDRRWIVDGETRLQPGDSVTAVSDEIDDQRLTAFHAPRQN